jgi:hypothetical protein
MGLGRKSVRKPKQGKFPPWRKSVRKPRQGKIPPVKTLIRKDCIFNSLTFLEILPKNVKIFSNCLNPQKLLVQWFN